MFFDLAIIGRHSNYASQDFTATEREKKKTMTASQRTKVFNSVGLGFHVRDPLTQPFYM